MSKKRERLPWLLFLPGVIVAISACWVFFEFRGFTEPPRVGERIEEVERRLGPPAWDTRKKDGAGAFRLGYTDGQGTRHLLHVRDGTIVRIDYSSR